MKVFISPCQVKAFRQLKQGNDEPCTVFIERVRKTASWVDWAAGRKDGDTEILDALHDGTRFRELQRAVCQARLSETINEKNYVEILKAASLIDQHPETQDFVLKVSDEFVKKVEEQPSKKMYSEDQLIAKIEEVKQNNFQYFQPFNDYRGGYRDRDNFNRGNWHNKPHPYCGGGGGYRGQDPRWIWIWIQSRLGEAQRRAEISSRLDRGACLLCHTPGHFVNYCPYRDTAAEAIKHAKEQVGKP